MKKTPGVKRRQPVAGDILKQKRKKTVDDPEVSNNETLEDDPSHNESLDDESEVSCIGFN
jgi:hypothetical protein